VVETTEVIGDGEGGGSGRVVRIEMVASRTSEGDSTLSMKSGVLIGPLVADMVVSIVAELSRCDKREREGNERRKKGER
jgi:hypothetical protein